MEIYTGTIKLYKPENGYGFIKLKNSREVFFHIKEVKSNEENIAVGKEVTFEIGESKKGPIAKNVEITP